MPSFIQSSTQEGLVVKTSAVDLSAKNGYFARIDTNGKAALPSAAGGLAQFVIEDGGSASGDPVTLRPLDPNRNVRLVIGSGGVTAGDKIATDSGGKAVTAVSGDFILGIAEETAAAGAYGLIRPGVPSPTTDIAKTAVVLTQDSLTDNSGGAANTTIAAITNAANAGSADVGPVKDAIADIAAQLAKIKVDIAAIKTVLDAAGITS